MVSNRKFWTYISPAIFFFTIVVFIPFIFGFIYSFTNWDGTSRPTEFVGLENYAAALSDPAFIHAFLFTVLFVIASMITVNLIGFSLAMLVTRSFGGTKVFRTIFFIPNMIGGIVLGFIWQFIFVNVFGFIGETLSIEFLQGWLSTTETGFLGMLILVTWQSAGYMMIIYIAAIQNIPEETLQAAAIDGASGFSKLKNIIIPLVMPAITVCLFLSMTNAFRLFDQNLSLTNGGPGASTEMISLNIYNTAYTFDLFSVAQAKAIIFFVILATIAIIQVRITKKMEVE